MSRLICRVCSPEGAELDAPTTLDHVRLAHRGVPVSVFRVPDTPVIVAPVGADPPAGATHSTPVTIEPRHLTNAERSLDDLRWYLHRALEYVDAGDPEHAADSLMNDLMTRPARPGDGQLFQALQVQDYFQLIPQGRAAIAARMVASGIGPPKAPGEPFAPAESGSAAG